MIALVLFTVFKQFERTGVQSGAIGYSEFLDEVRAKRIKSVVLQDVGGGSHRDPRQGPATTRDMRTTATTLDRGPDRRT